MTAFCADRLQEAVFAALKADENLGALLTGIYDEPPEGAACPYLSMADMSLTDQGVKDRAGASITFGLDIWSAEPSQMEAKELMARVDAALMATNLAVSGFTLVALSLQNAGVSQSYSSSGSLHRGHMSYSALLYAV